MRRTLRTLLCAVLAGAPLHAQDGTLQPEDVAPLREHYRPALHPGDPLRIVGLEQDGNELRAKTPLLARGEHEPLRVDTEAGYQRALALYGGTLNRRPTAPASANQPRAAARRPRYVESEPEPEARGPAATPWSVLAGLSVSVLLLVWYFVRVRPALVAPLELLDGMQPAQPDSDAEEFVFRPTRRAPAPFRPTLEAPPAALPQRPPGTGADARATKQPRR
jgi:hypothetical protein